MRRNISKYMFVMLCCLLSGSVHAQDNKTLFQTANSYYQNKQYEEAEKMYLLVVQKDSRNANAYYNLGNTYFHQKNYAYAVWNYEKALKLEPDNKYILHNIEETNNKLFSKLEFSKAFFVTQQLKHVVHTKSSKGWSWLLLLTLWPGVICLCIHFFTTNKALYRIGLVFLFASIVFAGFTYSAYTSEHRQDYAIILTPNAYLKSAPVESMNAATAVQTGTKVQIIDTDKNWMKVKLPNDKTGWIETSNLGLI